MFVMPAISQTARTDEQAMIRTAYAKVIAHGETATYFTTPEHSPFRYICQV